MQAQVAFSGRVRSAPAISRRMQAKVSARQVTVQAAKELKFWKYQGLGNDFILVGSCGLEAHSSC